MSIQLPFNFSNRSPPPSESAIKNPAWIDVSDIAAVWDFSNRSPLARRFRMSSKQNAWKRRVITISACMTPSGVRILSYRSYRVLQTTVDRGPDKTPLTAHFGGISLCWNKWVTVHDEFPSIWNKRSELDERLQAQKCELCGTTLNIEVHHIRKLADLKQTGRNKPPWAQVMTARKRKTLVACQNCHNQIHAGRYDDPKILKNGY